MEEMKQKIAYIKGLADGLDIDELSNEGKLFNCIIEALDLMAEEIEEVKSDHDELSEYVESVDEDLTELESDFYDLADDEGDDDEEDDEDDDEGLVVLECPDCGEDIYVEERFFEDEDDDEEEEEKEVVCPGCGKVMHVGNFGWGMFNEDDEDEDEDDDEDDD